jgi:hypothetical protein
MTAELADVIRDGQPDNRPMWGHDGTVRVVLTKISPMARAIRAFAHLRICVFAHHIAPHHRQTA